LYLFRLRPHPTSTLFPYTTLFRSNKLQGFRIIRFSSQVSARCEQSPGIRVNDRVPSVRQLTAQLNLKRMPGIIMDQQLHFRSVRSEEHTSELQSPYDLVCRLLLEK